MLIAALHNSKIDKMKQLKFYRLFLTVIAAIGMALSAHAQSIWDADPWTGVSVFKLLNIQDPAGNLQPNPSPNGSSVTIVDNPTYGGAFQFYKAALDTRCEAHGASGLNPVIGNTYYIGWSFKISSTVTNNAIFQWKSYGSPIYQGFPIVLKCVNGALQLHYFGNGGNSDDNLLCSQNISPNIWYNVVLKITVSDSWTGGGISYWLNGQPQVFSNGLYSYTGRTFDGSSVDPKWGIYGAGGTQVTNTIVGLAIGTTYDSVSPFSGTYKIQNVTSNMMLNNGGSLVAGTAITQWTDAVSPNLKWTFAPSSNGYFQIKSVKSGMALGVSGASTAQNAALVQKPFGTAGDDQWLPVVNSNGTWTFYNLNSGRTVYNAGGSTTKGTAYVQWSWFDSPNQQFNLIPVSP